MAKVLAHFELGEFVVICKPIGWPSPEIEKQLAWNIKIVS